MESLLILLGIIGLEVAAEWLKQRGQKRKEETLSRDFPKRNEPIEREDFPDEDDADFPDEDFDGDEDSGEEVSPAPEQPPALQDLIRKFREEQAKRSGEVPTVSESAPPVFVPREVLPERRAETHSVPPRPILSVEEKIFGEPQKVASPSPAAEKSPLEETKPASESKPFAAAHKARSKKPTLQFNRREAAKGFLWAKVLDDPRFKRRSPFPFTVKSR